MNLFVVFYMEGFKDSLSLSPFKKKHLISDNDSNNDTSYNDTIYNPNPDRKRKNRPSEEKREKIEKSEE